MKVIRQGDVLLVKVAAMPADVTAISQDKGRVILAHGEVTGHAHQIAEPTKAKLWSAGAERFLQVMEKTSLKHEEHSAAQLDVGIYHVAIQTQFTPQELRSVVD
ncbi:MAG: hypothetical protein IPM06_17685 [Rhizobiales bacterium]|nr:hypothetical protein [Hyphomicrobiales bacterium]